MWYTLTVLLGAFLLWAISNALITLLLWVLAIPDAVYEWPFRVLREWGHVPGGFVTLVSFAPHLVCVSVYYLVVNLPESRAFRFWSGWEWVRQKHFSVREPGPDDWRPPHLDQQVIYAVAPHGIYAEATTFYFVLNELYAGVVVMATSLLFWIPIVREFAALAGARPATTANIAALLDAGHSIIIMPEGMRGALHVDEGPAGVLRVLQTRKGFVRCALASKTHATLKIVPVYIHGVRELYRTWLPWPWLQGHLLSKYYYPWPIINWGWWGTFWPRKTPLRVCFGTPISLTHKDGVDGVHEEFMEQMRSLSN
jgi:hypothetical protein